MTKRRNPTGVRVSLPDQELTFCLVSQQRFSQCQQLVPQKDCPAENNVYPADIFWCPPSRWGKTLPYSHCRSVLRCLPRAKRCFNIPDGMQKLFVRFTQLPSIDFEEAIPQRVNQNISYAGQSYSDFRVFGIRKCLRRAVAKPFQSFIAVLNSPYELGKKRAFSPEQCGASGQSVKVEALLKPFPLLKVSSARPYMFDDHREHSKSGQHRAESSQPVPGAHAPRLEATQRQVEVGIRFHRNFTDRDSDDRSYSEPKDQANSPRPIVETAPAFFVHCCPKRACKPQSSCRWGASA